MSLHVHAYAAEPRAQGWSRPLIVLAYGSFFFGVLPGVLWLLGGRLDRLLGLPPMGHASSVTGGLIALAGLAWMGWSMATLSRMGDGLPISHLPPTRLVARGPYAFSRHPIYVGYAAAFAGAGAATHSIGRGVISTTLLVGGSIIYALGFEEPRLWRRYGQAYGGYADAVPALPVPRAVARGASRAWDLVRPRVEALANRVVLFRVGPFVCVTFGAFAGLGAALGLATCHLLVGGELALPREALYLAGLAAWMVGGARLAALLYQPRLLLRDPREALRSVGFVSWGGYLGMFTFPLLFAKVAGGDPWWLLDRACFSGLVCSCIGRVGCLAYGCCYGRPAEGGICWHHPEAKVNREGPPREHVPRIPTQLLSSACTASLVPIVGVTIARGAPGTATLLGSLLYAFARFGIECLRDEPRFGRWQLTRGQIGCALTGSACIAGLLCLPEGLPSVRGHLFASEPSRAAAWPVLVVASLAVFAVYSLHWKRVGRW